MIRIPLLFAVLLSSFLVSSACQADVIVIPRDGSTGVNITTDGLIQHRGEVIGEITSTGRLIKHSRGVGRLSNTGLIRTGKRQLISVTNEGAILQNNQSIGRITKQGEILRGDKLWGRATGCYGVVSMDNRHKVAAFLVLFTDFLEPY